MQRLALAASLTLIACSKGTTPCTGADCAATSSGGGSSSGSTSGSGGAQCNAETQPGLITVKAPCAATAEGATCANDWDCWAGQVCTAQTCTTTSTDAKKMGTLTLPDAGDYMVSVFVPADKPADAPPGVAGLTFDFGSGAGRDIHVWKRRAPNFIFDATNVALTQARVRAEPALRAGEAKALQRGVALGVALGVARSTSCSPTQFGNNGTCYDPDGASFQVKCGICGGSEITVVLKAVQGDTAILADTDDNLSASDSDLLGVLNSFATIAGPRDRSFFNAGKSHATNLDTDGNGLFAVVMSSKVGLTGAKVAGLFDYHDVLPASDSAASGNVMDMVWVQPPNIPFTPAGASAQVSTTQKLVIATIAHEYQHLINFARHAVLSPPVTETLFLNESLSHLAEDITGYGSSNIDSVAKFLIAPELTGLLQSDAGTDQDSSELRGLGYLYMRTLYEKWGGTTTDATGAITDAGALPKLDSFYTNQDTGLVALVDAGGSFFDNFFTFMPRLAISNNTAAAPLAQSDPRFNFNATTTDPATGQTGGINLVDPTRVDAHDATGVLNGYAPAKCPAQADAQSGHCEVFATGGVTFLWEGASANDAVTLSAPSAYNLRLVAVKVK